ncbi:hypothetical protein HAX54_030889, partial [Datura stramonium]|nr:hypothetical protein [Datura stramonium]
ERPIVVPNESLSWSLGGVELELGGLFRPDRWDDESSCCSTGHSMISQVCRFEERVKIPVVAMSPEHESSGNPMTH